MEQVESNLLTEMCSLVENLQLHPFNVAQEKLTQIEVERFLTLKGYHFQREIRLSAKDIPDFLIHTEFGEIVIEVKARFARRAIYRQLERYAEHENVHGLILLTGTSMKLPQEINGKPSLVASLGAGWL